MQPDSNVVNSDDGTRSAFTRISWVPVSLAAVTVASIALDVFHFRRHKPGRSRSLKPGPGDASGSSLRTPGSAPSLKHLGKRPAMQQQTRRSIGGSAPPPRRTTSVRPRAAPKASPASAPPPPIPAPAPLATGSRLSWQGLNSTWKSLLYHADDQPGPAHVDPTLNNYFGAFKAFGIATAAVSLTAAIGVVGVMNALGVHDTEEFAEEMRSRLLKAMPALAERLHRLPDPETDDKPLKPLFRRNPPQEPWTWAAAEARLTEAFQRGGLSAWADAVKREADAEGRLERRKR
ncbi:hypothetical protein PUNSTDRAFT_86773, partial [Punctularia strigosozonata HHB-11173 SS5]|uniref:uncharacterized protein n=1 Tax=Punctularia strigosozonata (strain HHB-11173) TaxID=741275 RepID=UPI00044179A3